MSLVCASPLLAQPGGEPAAGVQSAAGTQPGGPSPEDLRRQLQQLEAQLRAMEKADLGKRRVTTIGSAGVGGRGGVIRVYDLGDLFTVAPAYPAPIESAVGTSGGLMFGSPLGMGGAAVAPGGFGGMGGMGGGFFSVREGLKTLQRPAGDKEAARQFGLDGTATLQTTVDRLIEVIQQTISPELWTEGEGSIAQLGANLIVVADETTHQQIDDMLNLFRKRWGSLRTISVRAWWVWMTDDELTKLLADPHAAGDDGIKAFGLVKPDAWTQLLKPPAAGQKGDAPERRAGWQAAITCYNGQTVHTLSGGQRAQIIGITPSVSEREVAYSPLTGLLQEGVALQVTPVTNTTGQTVLLDVRSRVCLLADEQRLMEKVEKQPADTKRPATPNPAAQVAAVVERPKVQLHRLATTLRVPVGRPMLIGGMTFEERPEPGQPNLYLFVETHVQELRNDEEPADATDAAPAEAGE
jgi:hypothetical protein